MVGLRSYFSDESLREKVVDVWEDAITTGGWTPSELEPIPFTLLAGDFLLVNKAAYGGFCCEEFLEVLGL